MSSQQVRRQWEAGASGRSEAYRAALREIELLLEDEPDWIAAMATVTNVLDETFSYYHWTGFYRAIGGRMLVIGPYPGGHGCLRIAYDQGVCGAAARTGQTQLVPDVSAFPGHIACSASTQSEIVVPVHVPDGSLLAVLDVDSNLPAAFDRVDQEGLESMCVLLGKRYAQTPVR